MGWGGHEDPQLGDGTPNYGRETPKLWGGTPNYGRGPPKLWGGTPNYGVGSRNYGVGPQITGGEPPNYGLGRPLTPKLPAGSPQFRGGGLFGHPHFRGTAAPSPNSPPCPPQLLLLVALVVTPVVLGARGDPPVVAPSRGSRWFWGGGPGRPPCRPVNVTVALEKDACPQCRAVTATACGGFCRTREPVYRSPLGPPRQAACTYSGVRYERWILGGCPPGTDPSVTVPVALGCRCGRCPMAAADCAVLGLGPSFCGAPGGFGGS
uniref:Glycoprotein hormone subunit beta domain-containing protein n=1 Tax=Taeniopygia guttata TaxID=59729 RepID=A0A674GIU3_TAEGU